jgi:hypothetical protein
MNAALAVRFVFFAATFFFAPAAGFPVFFLVFEVFELLAMSSP